MTRVLVVLYKRPDLSWDEFRRYWREEHGRRAQAIPGLRRYTHYDAKEEGRPPYGIAALDFDSPEDMRRGLDTPQGRAAVGDLANFVDPTRTGMVVVEETGIIEVIVS